MNSNYHFANQVRPYIATEM